MKSRILNFIKYNNGFTLILAFVFIAGGTTFAANNPETFFAENQTIVSVDNSAILSANITSAYPNIKIVDVKQDTENFYITYSINILEIQDAVWVPVSDLRILKIQKTALRGGDLGLYVAKQLSEVNDYTVDYLKRVQKTEQQKGETKKMASVEYSGLIGKFLNPEVKELPGYTPTITGETSSVSLTYVTPTPSPVVTAVAKPASTLCVGSVCITEKELEALLHPVTIESSPTVTPTPTPTVIVTPTETTSPTPTETTLPTETPSPTPTDSGTPTPTESASPTPTETSTPTPVETVPPTPAPEVSPVESIAPAPSESPVVQ